MLLMQAPTRLNVQGSMEILYSADSMNMKVLLQDSRKRNQIYYGSPRVSFARDLLSLLVGNMYKNKYKLLVGNRLDTSLQAEQISWSTSSSMMVSSNDRPMGTTVKL